MKSNIREFTQKLFLLMDAKDGSQLQELVDGLMMDLQLRVTDRTARKTAACVLAERVFEVLIRAFAADSGMMEHEDKTLFLALYRAFYTDEFEEEPLPPTENAVNLLRRMQAEFGCRKQYEACMAYFRRYHALCDSLPQAVSQNMMMELHLIALPHLAEMLDRCETLQPQARRAVVIARAFSALTRRMWAVRCYCWTPVMESCSASCPKTCADWMKTRWKPRMESFARLQTWRLPLSIFLWRIAWSRRFFMRSVRRLEKQHAYPGWFFRTSPLRSICCGRRAKRCLQSCAH